MVSSDLFFILRWWAIFFLVGITFLPLTVRVFNSFIDRGYVFSKIIGISVLSYSIYILGSFHLLKFTQANILLVAVFWLVANLTIIYKRNIIQSLNYKLLFFEEVLFFAGLLLWSYVRSFSPDINGLEKFMDFGFINSILRSEYFPPKDMWLSPFSINYYYFGHLITATLTKISNIPSYITFNLMLATIFAFTFTMSFSIGINLVEKLKKFSLRKTVILGILFAYTVTFSGNLQPIYSLFGSYKGGEFAPPLWTLTFSPQTFPNSYWYPNATRFIHHTIHEFPAYSFVVSDLHGHVLSIPIVLTLIALAFILFIERKIKTSLLLLSSFLLSIAYMTNAWDALIYLGLFSVIIFILRLTTENEKVRSLKFILILLIGFFLFSFVFNRNFSPFASGIGLICSPQFLIDIGKLGPFIFEKAQCEHSPIWQLLILYGFFIFMLISFLLFLRKRKLLVSDIFVLIISLFSLFLIVVPEFIYLKDIYSSYFRANTMFKLSYQAFIMFSLANIYIFIRIGADFKSRKLKIKSKLLFFPFIFLSIGLFLISFSYPYFAIPSGYGNLTKYQGLDGLKYLKESKPDDYQAIIWINNNISNQPVILEAQGDSYTDYGRISANTGLPTVLGWTVHEWLWRGSYDVPASRFDPIKALYETDEAYTAKNIIDKYNIEYIYIGELENEKYKVSEEKFKRLGKIIFANGKTNIYKLR